MGDLLPLAETTLSRERNGPLILPEHVNPSNSGMLTLASFFGPLAILPGAARLPGLLAVPMVDVDM
jgi:hypothetical protein